MTPTREWVCPACAYSTTRSMGYCPFCEISLIPKARSKTERLKQEGPALPVVLERRDQ